MKKLIIMILIAAMTSTTMAGLPLVTETNYKGVKVKQLTLTSRGVIFTVHATFVAAPVINCDSVNSGFENPVGAQSTGYLLYNSHNKYDDIYSLLLSAKLSDEKINISFINDIGTDCQIINAGLAG